MLLLIAEVCVVAVRGLRSCKSLSEFHKEQLITLVVHIVKQHDIV